MTLQTFYRRLRKEDPSRWHVNDGYIRREDGCCPLGALIGDGWRKVPTPDRAALELDMYPEDTLRVVRAADHITPNMDPRCRAAILRNLGLPPETTS